MTSIKKKDLDTLKGLLFEDKRRIMRHLEELTDSSTEEMQFNSGDPADIASLEISQSSLQKIGKREKYLLKKIDYALAKIDNGTYGECENCGESIGVPRLMARPVAQLCIDCKTEQENSERKFHETEGEYDEGEFDIVSEEDE